MPALDNIAFVPPHTAGGELISAFGADKSDPFLIKAAQAFTIELETVMVPQEHQKRLLPQVSLPFLDGEKDMLVLSASSTSDHPEVQRVHYFGQAPEFRTPHSNFQSNTMYLTSDYNGKDQLQVSVRLVEVDTSNEERDTFLSEFQNLAGGAGALFPAVLPYVSAGVQLGKAIDKVITAVKPSNESRLVNRLNFHALPNENQIAFASDGTSFSNTTSIPPNCRSVATIACCATEKKSSTSRTSSVRSSTPTIRHRITLSVNGSPPC